MSRHLCHGCESGTDNKESHWHDPIPNGLFGLELDEWFIEQKKKSTTSSGHYFKLKEVKEVKEVNDCDLILWFKENTNPYIEPSKRNQWEIDGWEELEDQTISEETLNGGVSADGVKIGTTITFEGGSTYIASNNTNFTFKEFLIALTDHEVKKRNKPENYFNCSPDHHHVVFGGIEQNENGEFIAYWNS